MKKIKISKTLLIDSLINSDFLLLKKHYLLKNLNIFNTLKINKKSYINVLNPLDLVQSLKQFIRLLYFFKQQKKNLINFFVQDKHQKFIIKNFFVINKLNINYDIFFKFLNLKKKQKVSQLLISINEIYSNFAKISKFSLNKGIYLIQEINSINFQNKLGSYKIYNDLSDYKKLIFILIILNQVLNNSEKN